MTWVKVQKSYKGNTVWVLVDLSKDWRKHLEAEGYTILD